jgi:hypothetical protein
MILRLKGSQIQPDRPRRPRTAAVTRSQDRDHVCPPGRTLKIPRAPARGILDIETDDFPEVARTAKKIPVAGVKALDEEESILQQFREAGTRQVVFHLRVTLPNGTSFTAAFLEIERTPSRGRPRNIT